MLFPPRFPFLAEGELWPLRLPLLPRRLPLLPRRFPLLTSLIFPLMGRAVDLGRSPFLSLLEFLLTNIHGALRRLWLFLSLSVWACAAVWTCGMWDHVLIVYCICDLRGGLVRYVKDLSSQDFRLTTCKSALTHFRHKKYSVFMQQFT